MKLEEAIKGLEGMIKCGGIWEGGFEDDEKEILERLLYYIKEESIPKAVVEEIETYCKQELAFERRLKRENRTPDEFNQGRFYTCENILKILKGGIKI